MDNIRPIGPGALGLPEGATQGRSAPRPGADAPGVGQQAAQYADVKAQAVSVDRLDHLAGAIASGAYAPDPQRIAQAILDAAARGGAR
jgi:anti-sigma28 factor (negative regulator of flagellin synthesis)